MASAQIQILGHTACQSIAVRLYILTDETDHFYRPQIFDQSLFCVKGVLQLSIRFDSEKEIFAVLPFSYIFVTQLAAICMHTKIIVELESLTTSLNHFVKVPVDNNLSVQDEHPRGS